MRKILLLVFFMLALVGVTAAPLPPGNWKNACPGSVSFTEVNGVLQLKVQKPFHLDGSIVKRLSEISTEPMVFCGTVEGTKTGLAYLQVKLYKDGKEIARKSSKRSRSKPSELSVEFIPTGADHVELLCRVGTSSDWVGQEAKFSDLRLVALSEFNKDVEPLRLTPGYEACSIELNNRRATDLASFRSEISFRQAGSDRWLPALPLAYDPDEKGARGSLLNLKENTAYEVRISLDDAGTKETKELKFRTLSSQVPIAKTITLGADTKLPLIITESGTSSGYIRYTAKPGVVLDGGEAMDNVIKLTEVEYIILDGLTIRGGRINGILMDDSNHVQILNCNISGFSRIGVQKPEIDGKFFEGGRPLNNDAGIRMQDCKDVLVERCYIHDPRGTANSWFNSHPAGPNAIFVGGTEQAIFRYNDFIGSDQHRWNDAVEGNANGSENGSVCRDAEITGNYFAFCNDDGMELDGGQRNCRFMHNKSEGVLCGVSTAPCLSGPSYLIGNLFCQPGDELATCNAAIKNGFHDSGRGKIHFLHNTIVGNWRTTLNDYGGTPEERAQRKHLLRGYSRNNAALVPCNMSVRGMFQSINDFDYDMYYTTHVKNIMKLLRNDYGQEAHGVLGKPVFTNAERGIYTLAANSPGVGAGEPVPNVSDGGKAPNIGVLCDDLPFRPVPFHVDAAMVMLDTIKTKQLDLTVTVDDPAFKSEFQIFQNNCCKFFRVTPESGILAYGKPVKLTVSVNLAGIDSARTNSGAFLVRLPNGFSRPVSVYVDSTKEAKLLAMDRAGVIHGKIDSNSKAETVLSVEVPRDGLYYLFLRATEENKYQVRVDGGEPTELLLRNGSPQMAWRALSTGHAAKRNCPYQFSAGKHTVVIQNFTGQIEGFAIAEKPEALLLAPFEP